MGMNVYLSDLFFSHRHDQRDAYLDYTKQEKRDPEIEREKLMGDAVDFALMFEGATGIHVAPADLVADFYRRL